MKRSMIRIAWALLVLGALLSGCSRPSLEPVGAITLVQFAKEALSDELKHSYDISSLAH